jgi:hypothetical protein
MQTATFSNIDTAYWQAIKDAFAQKAGTTITDDTGSGESHGVKFGWSYSEETLTVTIFHVPWTLNAVGLNENSIIAQFTSWIDQAKG